MKRRLPLTAKVREGLREFSVLVGATSPGEVCGFPDDGPDHDKERHASIKAACRWIDSLPRAAAKEPTND